MRVHLFDCYTWTMTIFNIHRAVLLAAAALFIGGCAASGSHYSGSHHSCPHCKAAHSGVVCAVTQVR